MEAINSATKRHLAANLTVAATLARRITGLLGKKPLGPGEGLWIKPCMGIHTFGMKFPIDAVFLTKEHAVIGVSKNILPNRLSRMYLSAASVLELPAGKVEETGTGIGDRIYFL